MRDGPLCVTAASFTHRYNNINYKTVHCTECEDTVLWLDVPTSSADSVPVPRSGVWPFAECKRGMGGNFILCIMCRGWVNKRCSGIMNTLSNVFYFTCSVCNGNQTMQLRKNSTDIGDESLHYTDKFC